MHRELRIIARRRRERHDIVQRARIILHLHKGYGTQEAARYAGCSERSVREWKRRFLDDPRVRSLRDRPRSGRPPLITVELRCELVQLACERPDTAANEKAAPFRDVWTYASIAKAFEARTGFKLSASEARRILRFKGLRPHRVRQWLKSRDPDFGPKATAVCHLYLEPPSGVLISVDEKPMQALERVSATHVDPKDGSVRREYEYKRHGTQVLLAAFNVRTGWVHAKVVPRRSGAALVEFMDEIAAAHPTGDIHVVWDNLNTHYDGRAQRWTKFNERHGGRFHFTYTPKHASWLNQVEIWFSILHRRVLKHASFKSKELQKNRVEGFIRRWNETERHPFRWTWRYEPRKNRSRSLSARAIHATRS